MPARRTAAALVAATLVALVAGLLATAAPGTARTPAAAPARTAGNPLVAGPWGTYTGISDGVYPAYEKATGYQKALLGKIALQPRVLWFGGWIPEARLGRAIHAYIADEQDGNPDALVQLAVFREFANGESRRDEPITKAQATAYRRWVDLAATAIGDARVAMVLEPDLAVGLKGWRPGVRLSLVRYAARRFSALPRTTVYLDGSDADWLPVTKAVTMLRQAGVAYTRGFALGATHYASTAMQIMYAQKVSNALARAGLPGKKAVIDTADNGAPFTYGQYHRKHPRGDFDNAEICRTKTETLCDTLGIPPTTDVANARWRLPALAATTATQYVDAYLWFGRPWLYRQASPFSLARALGVAKSTRY